MSSRTSPPLIRIAALSVALLAAGTVHSQDGAAAASGPQSMLVQMATFGGSMHATAELCGGYSATELKTMRQQQKQASVEGGANPAAFDAAFDVGHANAKRKMANASAPEKAKACAQAKQMGK